MSKMVTVAGGIGKRKSVRGGTEGLVVELDFGHQKSNPAFKKAYALAIRIVKAYKHLTEEKKEFVLAKQLLRSGTSIEANLAEAHAAISEADMSAKVSIAYKETKETQYWLNLLKDTGYIDEKAYDSIFPEVDEIGAILFVTIRKTRSTRPARRKTT